MAVEIAANVGQSKIVCAHQANRSALDERTHDAFSSDFPVSGICALQQFIQQVREAFEEASAKNEVPVLLTSPQIRPFVRSIIERFRPATVVMSQNSSVATNRTLSSSGWLDARCQSARARPTMRGSGRPTTSGSLFS